VLHALGQLARVCGRIAAHVSALLVSLYDVYIALPLRLEGWVQGRRHGDDRPLRTPLLEAEGAKKRVAGEGVA
jgi:hypothetical protein